MPGTPRTKIILSGVLILFLAFPTSGDAYSVLTHEAIVDAVWATHIRPLLQKRFPNATQDELRQAHAYAYGGAIIQDLGYYPHGNRFFSNLTHYIRSGDFIEALLRDSRDINEYAFAIGSMSHWVADNDGHRLAVNRAVPLLYPELKKKYGDVVTFEDSPLAHVKTEFGFDVLEVARGRFAPDAYHDFIGFEVAQPLLDRAFEETYGVKLSMVLQDETTTIGSYRHAVSNVIPKATKVAWEVKKDDIQKDLPGITRGRFLYNLSRASYEKSWGRNYRKPNVGEKVLAFFFRLIPKIGPLRILTFRTPTPETEKMFEASFNATLDRYRSLLTDLGAGRVTLPNDNFDVGARTAPGEYRLNDDTYAELLHHLAEQNFSGLTPELRAEIERFYADPASPNATRRTPRRWSRVLRELLQLESAALRSPNGSSAGATR
ncbi:MAG: zinc dependent phospholipase C family protein [Acidobacteriia bacterium]|nr:zinc dependent phospholipase C family protein [Terriglobia bacterium]